MNLSKIIRDLVNLRKELEAQLGNVSGTISYVTSYILQAVNEIWGFTYSTFSDLLSGNPPSSLDTLPSRVDNLENDFYTHVGSTPPPYSHTADQIQIQVGSNPPTDLQSVSDNYLSIHLQTQLSSPPFLHTTDQISHDGIPLSALLDASLGTYNLEEASITYTPTYAGVLTYPVQVAFWNQSQWEFYADFVHLSFDPSDFASSTITRDVYYWDPLSSSLGPAPNGGLNSDITLTGSGPVEGAEKNSRILPIYELHPGAVTGRADTILELRKVSDLNTFGAYTAPLEIFRATNGANSVSMVLVYDGSSSINLEFHDTSTNTLIQSVGVLAATSPASMPIYAVAPIYDNTLLGSPPIARGLVAFVGLLDKSGIFRYIFLTFPAYNGTDVVYDGISLNYSSTSIQSYTLSGVDSVSEIYRLFGYKGLVGSPISFLSVFGLDLSHVGAPLFSVSQEAEDFYRADLYLPVGIEGIIAHWFRVSATLTLDPSTYTIASYFTSISRVGSVYMYQRIIGAPASRTELVDDVLESASSGIYLMRMLPNQAIVRYAHS